MVLTGILASGRWTALEPIPTRTSTTTYRGLSTHTDGTLTHRAPATRTVRRDECGRALGRRSGTSSSPSRSMWRPKSKDASWACLTSSLRFNSSVILATNTQVVSGRRPRAIVTKASLEIGRVFPDGGCRAHFVDVSLSGSPTLMYGPAMICVIHKHNILLDIHRKERL
jgi:hypothetical protein